MKALIIGDKNKRAAIACLRALREKGVPVHVAFSARRARDQLIYRHYLTEGNVHYYSDKTKEGFTRSLSDIRERIGDYQILPIGETLVRWLSEQKEHLLARGVLVRVAEADTYERLSAKDEFLMICGENGIPTPPILENLNLDRFTGPFVVKPKGLMGGRGVLTFPLLVEDASSFRAFKSMQLDLRKHLIQAYVRGPSIYYCAMYRLGQEVVSFQQINLVQQPDGKSVLKAVPFQEFPERISTLVRKLFSDINYDGVMMMEFKRCLNTGNYYAIECNPRLWGPLQLAIDNGVNFPALLCDCADDLRRVVPVGYSWRSGFLDGLWIKIASQTCFQRWNYPVPVSCRDIWWRPDTRRYAVLEPVFLYASRLSKSFTNTFRRWRSAVSTRTVWPIETREKQ